MARVRRVNEYPVIPIANVATFISTGTADGDPTTTMIAPSDATIGRSVIRGITNGTGTALITSAWYTAASRGGTVLSTSHVDSAGAVYDLDAAAGVVYIATNGSSGGQQLPVTEGGRFFLNFDFDAGSASAAGTFGVGVLLIL